MREAAGLALQQAAPQLDFSASKLSRIENAQVVIDVHWVKSMLDVYDVGGDRGTELMDLAREAKRPGWWRAYGLGNNSYIAFETEATRIQDVTPTYVPGLMQTADYARALMLAVPVRRSAEQPDGEVAARMYRQQRLASVDNPLELVAVIDGSALHRPVGGHDVLRRQLAHMTAIAALASGFTIAELRRPRRTGHRACRARTRRTESRQGRRCGAGQAAVRARAVRRARPS